MSGEAVTIGSATLYRGDCLEVMEGFGPATFDAVITDPPYCSGGATEATRGAATHQGLRTNTISAGRFQWFESDNMTTAGLCELMRRICVRAADTMTDGGSVLVFADWRMVTALSPVMESAGLRQRNLLVWDKGHFGCGTGFRPSHEMIIHLTKRSPQFHSNFVGNVLRHPRTKDRIHPTQKPVELLGDLVEVTSPVGGAVLDPFGGSFSTGAACMRLGRRFVGIERDPRIFDEGCERLEAEAKRPSLLADIAAPSVQLSMIDEVV
jgi:site-specific DNA-methyltransferase (adenine-specific)